MLSKTDLSSFYPPRFVVVITARFKLIITCRSSVPSPINIAQSRFHMSHNIYDCIDVGTYAMTFTIPEIGRIICIRKEFGCGAM